jgi:hypothetical protein
MMIIAPSQGRKAAKPDHGRIREEEILVVA